MRQQLVSWLIDDIAPAVRKNHDPESTILKFAKAKNLEPALVQSLGQLFNTAKTLAYIETSADKGDNFPILDVDTMVDKYLEVRPSKKASISFTTVDENKQELPEFFAGLLNVPVQLDNTYSEEARKTANFRPKELREASEHKHMLETLEQCRADIEEDARELLLKHATFIKHNEVNFQKVERDALGLYGESIRPVTDLLASFCKAAHVKVERATDGGTSRLIHENEDLLKALPEIGHCLEKLAAAKEMREEIEKQALVTAPIAKATQQAQQIVGTPKPSGKSDPSAGHLPKAKGEPRPDSAPRILDVPENMAADGKNLLSALTSAGSKAISPILNAPAHAKQLSEALGGVNNKEQKHVDTAYAEAKHLAVLQHLLTTDEVLAEADPEHVVNMYNTLRRASPSMASDPNVVRVALRTMIQHDGISPFDLKGLLDTENSTQSQTFNKKLMDSIDYQGASMKPPTKPSK